MGVFKRNKSNQDLCETDQVNEKMIDANILKFAEIKFVGRWERNIISGSSNIIQYKPLLGSRVNSLIVTMPTEKNTPIIYEIKENTDLRVIVINDVVHVPLDRRPPKGVNSSL